MHKDHLPENQFSNFVKRMPLVSVDLCVCIGDQNLVLVKREMPPAKDYLFTPGGRILKNESIDQAIHRILSDELGIIESVMNFEFISIFEHFYEDSAFCANIDTHYVCLLYSCRLENFDLLNLNLVKKEFVGHNEILLVNINDDLKKYKIHHYAMQNINAFRATL